MLHVEEAVRLQRATLTDQVVDSVRDMVRDGRLGSDELYSVQQLSTLLGVSRSPVREALLKLAEAGLVSFERNRGFRVTVPDGRDLADIFEVRLVLETEAAARAAAAAAIGSDPDGLPALLDRMRRAAAEGDEDAFWGYDRQLHQAVLRAAGNGRAERIVDDLRRATWLLGRRTTPSRSLADIAAEHEPVVAAIVAGDPEAARDAMRAHLTGTGRLLIAQALGCAPTDPRVDEIWPTPAPLQP
jgi:DNA-binding GntR family transcriptional regulator